MLCGSGDLVIISSGRSTKRLSYAAANDIVNVEPDPEHVHLGMKVKLVTTLVGTDSAGTEAIGFGFQPVD